MKKIEKIKQKRRIFKCISIILLSLLFIPPHFFSIYLYAKNKLVLQLLMQFLLLVATFLYLLIVCYVIDILVISLENKKLKPIVLEKFQLTINNFVEVICIDYSDFDEKQISKFAAYDARFFARLTTYNYIEIKIELSDNTEEYQTIDFIHFNEYYKP